MYRVMIVDDEYFVVKLIQNLVNWERFYMAVVGVSDNGLGCDAYIEASGSPQSVTQGLNALVNLGRYVQMGVFAEEVTADWNTIGDGKELQIIGSHLSALTFPAVIRGIESGLLKTEGLISHQFSLAQWKEAFEVAEVDPNAVKVMLVP